MITSHHTCHYHCVPLYNIRTEPKPNGNNASRRCWH